MIRVIVKQEAERRVRRLKFFLQDPVQHLGPDQFQFPFFPDPEIRIDREFAEMAADEADAEAVDRRDLRMWQQGFLPPSRCGARAGL